MARIGLLTGGGDCPGLNAVIRAVVRRGLAEGGHSFVGFRHGWAGVLDRRRDRADASEHGRDPSARRDHSRNLAHEPVRRRPGRRGAGAAHARGPRRGRADPDRRARTRSALPCACISAGVPIGGRAQDDRQRPRRNRCDVRLSDGRADRHRRDRSPAHDRRVAQPRDGRRGDGPPCRLDRHACGHRRRSGRDPRAGASVRHRARSSSICVAATSAGAASRSWWSPRAPRRAREPWRRWRAPRPTPSGTCVSGGSA